jgi:transglutaminase-like putative cysteine protease
VLWVDPSRQATRQAQRSGWLERALILTSLLVLSSGYRTVVEGNDWWVTAVLVTIVTASACAVLRALGVRVVAPFAAIVLLITIVWIFVPDTLAAGFPTPGSVSALAGLVGDARRVIVDEQAPVAAARGIVLLVAFSFGALVVVADVLLELRRAAAWIGLLLLGVYAVPAMVSGSTPGFWLFAVAAVPWLLVLRIASPSATKRPSIGVQVPAVLLAVVALAAAFVLPTVAPDIRAAAASWGKPPPSVFGRGINPMLELGQNLRRSSKVVALQYTTTAENPLYLKVATLRDFTGRTWRPGETLPEDRFEGDIGLRQGIETKVDTTRITIKGLDSPLLPVPYVTEDTQGLKGAWRYERMGMTVRSDSGSSSGQNYTVSSLTITPTADEMRQLTTVIGPSLRPYVQLPTDVPASIVDTAREVTASARTDYDKALALQDFFRNSGFRYSETAPVADDYDGNGLSVIAAFLKEKAGYCVHFSSAMAVMARAIGIPARVAVGYAPGHAIGVRDGDTVFENTSDDLHAWTELFFEGAGWIRFDPTVSVGSATSFQERSEQTPDSAGLPAPGESNARERNQASGADGKTAASTGTAPRTLAVTGSGILLILLAPGLIRVLRRRRRLQRGAASPEPLWRELEDLARDLRLDVTDTDTPRGFASRLAERPGLDPEALERLLHRVEMVRFARSGSVPDPASVRDTEEIISALRAGSPPAGRWRARLLPRSLGPRPTPTRTTFVEEPALR